MPQESWWKWLPATLSAADRVTLANKKVRRKYRERARWCSSPVQRSSCETHQQCKSGGSINLIFCNVLSSCSPVMEKAGMSGILLSDAAPLEADAIRSCRNLHQKKIPDATVCVCVCVCLGVCAWSCASYTVMTLILCGFTDVTLRSDAMDFPEGIRALNVR